MAQPGDLRRRPRPGSCSIRGQRVWPACDCPHMLSVCPAASPSIEESCCDLEFPLLCPALLVSPDASQPLHPSIGSSWPGQIAVDVGASVFGKEEQEAVAAPAIHSPTATYAGIGPSVAGQPRSNAHLLPMPPLGGGAYHKDLVTAVAGT